MKGVVLHIICLLFAFVPVSTYSQDNAFTGYRIEGDEVVFSFNKSDYEKATHANGHGHKLDFRDLDIKEVFVSGEFNNWSRKKWRMTKIDEERYELRKKLADFNDRLTWEFKFVVNKLYWAEPSKKESNSVMAREHGAHLGVYNLKMFTANPDSQGNLTFFLKGYQDAKNVVLSGNFNLWDEQIFKMNKTDDGWELKLKIQPGEYEYKFIIDGQWITDPDNPNKRRNEFDEFNSFIDIKATITFFLKDHLDAHKVILAGSFNDWDEHAHQMTKTTKGWTYTVTLSGGKHHYKFIVDHEWIIDPDNPVMEYDNHGNINSVYMVK